LKCCGGDSRPVDTSGTQARLHRSLFDSAGRHRKRSLLRTAPWRARASLAGSTSPFSSVTLPETRVTAVNRATQCPRSACQPQSRRLSAASSTVEVTATGCDVPSLRSSPLWSALIGDEYPPATTASHTRGVRRLVLRYRLEAPIQRRREAALNRRYAASLQLWRAAGDDAYLLSSSEGGRR